jgi:hypothetical protein
MPSADLKNIKENYFFFKVFYPVVKLMAPKYISTLEELGFAMINSVLKGYENQVIEVKDILELSKK